MDDQIGVTGLGLPAYRGEGRGPRLHQALAGLLGQAPELEAAAVVSFDGLPMASALPLGMDEDRVAAMSAALLSLGEKAAAGLGRGSLAQVYVEGESGTVFLVSAADEAVLVAVAARGAKTGLMLWEVRKAAAQVGLLLGDDAVPRPAAALPAPASEPVPYPPPEEASAGLPVDPLAGEAYQREPYQPDPHPAATYQAAADTSGAGGAGFEVAGSVAAFPPAADGTEWPAPSWSTPEWQQPPRADDPWTP